MGSNSNSSNFFNYVQAVGEWVELVVAVRVVVRVLVRPILQAVFAVWLAFRRASNALELPAKEAAILQHFRLRHLRRRCPLRPRVPKP